MVTKRTTAFKEINTIVRITSGELRKILQEEGEILSISLFKGRSPYEKELGKSADDDIWEINLFKKREL